MKKRKNSKSAFIKAQSMTKSAKDVITEAKAVGLEISADYVHSVRSEMRRGAAARAHVPFGKKTPVTKTRKSSKKTIFNAVKNFKRYERLASAPDPVRPRAEVVLLAAASELGLGPAMELLTNERKRVRGILG